MLIAYKFYIKCIIRVYGPARLSFCHSENYFYNFLFAFYLLAGKHLKERNSKRGIFYPLKIIGQEKFKNLNFRCSDKRYKENHAAKQIN